MFAVSKGALYKQKYQEVNCTEAAVAVALGVAQGLALALAA